METFIILRSSRISKAAMNNVRDLLRMYKTSVIFICEKFRGHTIHRIFISTKISYLLK